MARLVSFPMYAAPAMALAAFWRGLRGHMRRAGIAAVPDDLAEPDDLAAHWAAPDLLLSQTCGYPFVTGLAGRVQYVATPHYNAPGCLGPLYSSVIIVRKADPARSLADLRGRRGVFNSCDSHSGYNALRAMVAPLAGGAAFFSSVNETGAHRASIRAVRDGAADVAAIDAVTFALLRRDAPDEVAGLRILATTELAPGLPLITGRQTSLDEVRALRAAWRAALDDPDLAAARAAMLLDGCSVLPVDDYTTISTLAEEARRVGYPTLA